MFPLAIVLAVAALRADGRAWHYALPRSGWGLLIAPYHTLLYYGVIMEAIAPCSKGPSCTDSKMTGSIPLPALSVLAFSDISILLLISRRKSVR